MMDKRILFFSCAAFVVMILMAGCFPADRREPQEVSENMAQTYAVQTLQSMHQVETIVAQTLTAEPTAEVKAPEEIATETPEPTSTATLEPTLTPTEALTVPIVEVSVSTNCRTGPGVIYDKVAVLLVGRQAEVIGRNAPTDYWIIKTPGGTGYCWLWGRHATVRGPVEGLAHYPAPPTPTPSIKHTGTPGVVTLQVSVPTNCRTGPGKAYEIVSVLRTNKTARVIARNADSSFWVIENPESSGECWVWGNYAKVTGAVSSLPVREHPPVPTTTAGVTLKVSVPTNCRTGPGKAYEIVSVLHTEKRVDVLGRNAESTYWVVQNPAGSGSCWVWGNHASLSGPVSSVPVAAIPPTPTPTPKK